MTSQWRVGAILNEPLADTLRFAAWYLDAGASGLTLLFDNPEDPALEVLASHPSVTCIPCTAEFWADLGLTPDTRFTKRQNMALSWVYRSMPDGWLLNVDADEFLHVINGAVSSFLAAMPAETEAVRVETAEIVVGPAGATENIYRLPMERDVARRVYGDSAALFGPRRKGLIGHPQGKSFVRCGLPGVSLRQHWAQRADGSEIAERYVPVREGAALLHHIGLDYAVWRAKLDWRLVSSGFTVPLTERIRAMLDLPDAEERLRTLHADLHGVDAERLDRLRAEGVSLELPIDLDGITARRFGKGHGAA
ncbi:glycosyltransferase family 2 protein [Ruegeria sp. PrR005]|uniref:Glycosyltransferase family 2 protein n=1 Tax=Ruegeria sp. PrR005 TaxID=2706882 RepID=A0A6B2NVC0_9RHOB|nr:glycosyltransferase family 2 protein [Ruegeria sp. PrR005]NDW46673.1 glycosyltransferase family 2 protein [Ruegeria sp. PrR005]